MSAAEEAEYCSGPKLMAWLKEVEPGLWADTGDMRGNKGRVNTTIGPNWNRRFYEWSRGAQPNVYTVDKLMVALGRHLLEIPEDVWQYECNKGGSRTKPEEKAKALRMLEEGYLPTEVAAELGVVTRTVTNWAKKERVAKHWGRVPA